MSIGGAVARSVLSLGLVLALVVGAIKYLKRRGYGAAGADYAFPASKPAFGVSPVAQMLLAVSAKPKAVEQERFAGSSPHSAIGDFEVLGTQPLPGSNHTLYKVRVGERILLLGGNATGGLSVLTEWDSDSDSGLDTLTARPEHGFDSMLVSVMDDPQPQNADSLQGAADRLTAAIRRAGAQNDASVLDWRGKS